MLFATAFMRAVCNSRSTACVALESFVDSLTAFSAGTAMTAMVAPTAITSISSMSENPRGLVVKTNASRRVAAGRVRVRAAFGRVREAPTVCAIRRMP